MSGDGNSLLHKFENIKHQVNKNLLLLLFQVKEIVSEPEDSKEEKQLAALESSYLRWYNRLMGEPDAMELCNRFYEATKDSHEQLIARDVGLFSASPDFFATVYDCEGLDSAFLFGLLDSEGQSNLWEALIGIYRLSVLICIYLQMPFVKDIIDMIVVNNPDLNASNVFQKIMKDFKSKRQLRSLIMKLLKSKGDDFSDIFGALQRVIATFGTQLGGSGGAGGLAAMASGNAKAKAYETFAELAKDHWTPSKPEDVELVFEALGKKAEEPPVEMEAEQWTALGEVFQKGNFAQVHSVVSDLGKTMEGMMSALNSGDDAAVEDVLRKSGALQHMTDGDFNDLKSQMEEFEDEFKEMGLE